MCEALTALVNGLFSVERRLARAANHLLDAQWSSDSNVPVAPDPRCDMPTVTPFKIKFALAGRNTGTPSGIQIVSWDEPRSVGRRCLDMLEIRGASTFIRDSFYRIRA